MYDTTPYYYILLQWPIQQVHKGLGMSSILPLSINDYPLSSAGSSPSSMDSIYQEIKGGFPLQNLVFEMLEGPREENIPFKDFC